MRNSAIICFSTLCLAAAAAASPPTWIAPEHSGRLSPCCDNEHNAYPPLKALAGRALPDHAFHPPGERDRLKAAARVNPDLPPARALDETAEKALRVHSQFEGLDIVQAGLAFPPDTIVAASATKVLEATNVALRLSDRDGRNATIRSLEDFFGLPTANSFHFDPKVYYDRLSGRFFVVDLDLDFVERQSFIYLSVSRSSSPADLVAPRSWCNYRLNGRVGRSWADFPGLGMNERWLAVTVNNFNFSGSFRSAFVYALDKRRLADNAAACPRVDFHRFRAAQDGHGQVAFTVQPAFHYSTTALAGTPLFLVSSDVVFEVAETYTLWRLTEGPGGVPELGRHGVRGTGRYTIPPNAPQRDNGTELDTGDQRVSQAAFRDGVVWTAHTTGCNFGFTPGESCVKAVGITPTADGGTVTFEETFGGGDDWFVWMPSVAVNGRGDVAVAFQRSRGTMSTGVAFAGKPAASNRFETLARLVNGRCSIENFDGQRNRTGDYVGVQTDPADDLTFWIAGEYTGNVGKLGCNWRTRVARVGF